jgi:hypothetical protein
MAIGLALKRDEIRDTLLLLSNNVKFFPTLIRSHFKLSANPRPIFVNRTKVGISIHCGTPAIAKSQHRFSTPFIHGNMLIGHASIADDHDFHTTTTSLAVRASHISFGYIFQYDIHKTMSYLAKKEESIH